MSELIRRVAITGGSGYIGSRLVEKLENEPQIDSIVNIDSNPPSKLLDNSKVTFIQHDISTPLVNHLQELNIQAMIHLAHVLRPSHSRKHTRQVNVGGTSNILNACATYGIKKIIYLSSTTIYGAHPNNPQVFTEKSPIRPNKGFQYSEDKAEAETKIKSFLLSNSKTKTTILRSCPVIGPNANNFVSNAFLKPFLISINGYDPPMQFIHENDLTNILHKCVIDDIQGLYNIAGNDFVFWSEVGKILKRMTISLPTKLLYTITEMLWLLRLQSQSTSSGLNFIKYPWIASTEKIKSDLGIKFEYSSKQSLEYLYFRLSERIN